MSDQNWAGFYFYSLSDDSLYILDVHALLQENVTLQQ